MPADTSLRPTSSRLADAVPGSAFAFVMATGIVSIAAGSQHLSSIAAILFAINLVVFPLLLFLILFRLLRHPAELVNEFAHHKTAPGFLTIVAAVAVLGNEFAVQTPYSQIAKGLWLAGCGLWLGLGYGLFMLLTTRPAKPSLRVGLDGTWLLVVVATEALAVLGTHVADSFARPDIIVFLSLCWFLLGGFFYLIIIAMILGRWLFEPLPPEELTPPYWINMGAMAIATLAGARLELVAGANPLVASLAPTLATITVLFWTVATWWIPLLLGLTIWRHAVRRVPLSYRFEYWSMVFPLGMYTAASWNLAYASGLDFMYWLPRVFIWAALAAWAACFQGMVRRGFGRN